MRLRHLPAAVCCLLAAAAPLAAQTATRQAILQAEDRRAPTARDLQILRQGARSADGSNALMAVRALGRLERPALIGDLVLSLRHRLPEVRAEAANAVAQAAEGWRGTPTAAGLDQAARALEARLAVEDVPAVRAAILEALGRLPYTTAEQASHAAAVLLTGFEELQTTADRLGFAEGLETFTRRQKALGPVGGDVISALVDLATLRDVEATSGARIRRLALEGLINAGRVDVETVKRASDDPDPQVRRLAMRAAALPGGNAPPAPAGTLGGILAGGLTDGAAMVRVEAARGIRVPLGDEGCGFLVGAAKDRDTHVAVMALDQLASCRVLADAVAALEQAATGLSHAASPRGWHRAAHAIVALASAVPDRARVLLPQFTGSSIWQLRMYAARAAAVLDDRGALEKLAADPNDNVREAAIDGLVTIAGHAADGTYIAALSRGGHQVIRAAAIALTSSRDPAAAPALKAALQRLVEEDTDNGTDPRAAIVATLASVGSPVPTLKPRPIKPVVFDAGQLKRLASPRAQISIKDVGSFEIALFTREAPATVLRFAQLAEEGYYNGTTFHRIIPNVAIQGGGRGANEYIGHDWFMRDELGLWPHVRGAVGISTRGRDTGDAQIFIDTVDNPRFDHNYTVFAQVLNGIDVVDLILEGDVIETIEIIP